jgi:hypothetical protein
VAPPVRLRAPRRARAVARRYRVAATCRAARARLKAAIGTTRRASRQRPPQPRARACRLAPRTVIPIALHAPPPPRPSRCRPDRRGPKPPTPSVAVPPAARPSTSRRAAVPSPVSHPFLGRLPCAGAVPPLAHRAVPPLCSVAMLSWAAHATPAEAVGREHGPRPRCATGPSAVSAQWQPI